MEEILASIRRIIADDQESIKTPDPMRPPLVLAPVPAPFAPVDDDDVLDLAEVAPLPPKAALPPRLELEIPDISFRDVEGNSVDLDAAGVAEEPEPEPEPPPPKREPSPLPRRPAPPPASNEDHLISSATDATVGQAFNLLANTVSSSNSRTLEELVREMLRPMLKNWLDDNLPTIVERLVRAEIERVARGK